MILCRDRLILPLLAATVALGGLAAACSDDEGGSSSSTTTVEGSRDVSTTVGDGDDTTSTPPSLSPDTSVTDNGTVPVPSTLAPEQTLALAVYWMRPFGEPRPIDIPAHQDGAGGPFPLVLYGSVTNNTAGAVTGATLDVVWRDAAGAVQATTPGRLVAPDGGDLAELAPGATTDFIVVVGDEPIASRLIDLQPSLAEG